MIKIGKTEYRNLEEQVQYNTSSIQSLIEGNETIGRFGIKIVGQVPTSDLIPTATEYQGEYGDAYLVGIAPPYDYYIFTRPFEGQTNNQWFPLGKFPAPGPQGDQGVQGEQGEQGERGSKWFSNSNPPSTTSGYEIGDYSLIPSIDTAGEGEPGSIYHLHDVNGVKTWLFEGNIRGPQGIPGKQGNQGEKGDKGEQGIQGPAGPVGPLVDIVGEITSIDQLPDPTTVPRQTAYLYLVNNTKHVYIIVGDDENLTWYDAGIFAAGTIVTESGLPLEVFDSDTKLNRKPGTLQVYVNDLSGNPTTKPYDTAIVNNAIVARDSAGQIIVRDTPTQTYHAASKKYVDTKVPLPTTTYSVNTIQFVPANKFGVVNTIGLTSTVENNRVVQRTGDANITIKANVPLDKDYAIGAKQVATMVDNIAPATITGENLPANATLTDAIGSDETGFFVIVGPTRLTYTMRGQSQSVIESKYHLILKYYETNNNVYRMVHIYFRAPTLDDFTVTMRNDGILTTGLTITNLQSTGGARIIKMPMNSPTT